MARQGGKIEPNVQIFGLGWGAFHVSCDSVQIEFEINEDDDPKESVYKDVDTRLAPLFRMIANRLDEIAGKRKRRA